MTPEQTVMYIQAQRVCAECELEAMKVANRDADDRIEGRPYNEQDFNNLPNKYGIHHNAMLTFLGEAS